MIAVMSLDQELRDLVAELRKHKASHDSILMHALMHNRKSGAPWSDDDVRRFLRSYEATEATVRKDGPSLTPYNIVVRSEVAGGVELKDFDSVVRERSADSAERARIFRSATESQRLVRVPGAQKLPLGRKK